MSVTNGHRELLERPDALSLPGALNPPPALPIQRAPGQSIGLSEVVFTYAGPPRAIIIGWGIKPAGGLFGLDWNDGQHLIRPFFAFTPQIVISRVVATPEEFRFTFSPPTATVPTPTPGTFTSRGNQRAGRPPVTVQVNAGTFDTWVWAVDASAIAQAGLPLDADTMTWERFLLALDDDADVGEIVVAAALSNLELRYVGL